MSAKVVVGGAGFQGDKCSVTLTSGGEITAGKSPGPHQPVGNSTYRSGRDVCLTPRHISYNAENKPITQFNNGSRSHTRASRGRPN